MNGATFGALAAAKTLLDAGFEGRQAEAVAATIRDGRAGLATKSDLDAAVSPCAPTSIARCGCRARGLSPS